MSGDASGRAPRGIAERAFAFLDRLVPAAYAAPERVEDRIRGRAFVACLCAAVLCLTPISVRDIARQGVLSTAGLLHVVLQAGFLFGLLWRRTRWPLGVHAGTVLLVGLAVIYAFSMRRPFLVATSVFWVNAVVAGGAFFVGLPFAFALWGVSFALNIVHFLSSPEHHAFITSLWPLHAFDRLVDMTGASFLVFVTLLSYRVIHMRLTREIARRNQLFLEQQAALQNAAKFVALGEFAGALAHQLNNPLTVVLGRARQARALLAPDAGGVGQAASRTDVEGCLERIEATSLHMARIIEALRRFSRSGEREPTEAARLTDVLGRVTAIVGERIRAEGIALSIDCPDDLRVVCRPVLLEQVFLNLLSNARQAAAPRPGTAADHGGGAPWIRVVARRDGGTAVVSVEDSGPGVPLALVDAVFQPFFTTKPPDEGTGLGLSLSLGIVRDVGGELALERPSGPTRFTARLPLAPRDQSTS